jgi:hypothetical protein
VIKEKYFVMGSEVDSLPTEVKSIIEIGTVFPSPDPDLIEEAYMHKISLCPIKLF